MTKEENYRLGLSLVPYVVSPIAGYFTAMEAAESSGKKIHNRNLAEAEENLDIIEASVAAGDTSQMIEYTVTHQLNGQEIKDTEYRPVPLEELKTEQIQLIDKMKAEPPQIDLGTYLATLIVINTLTIVTLNKMLEHNSNAIEKLACKMADGERAITKGFQNAGKSIMRIFKKDDGDDASGNTPSTPNTGIQPV